jgi:hypothetical protein
LHFAAFAYVAESIAHHAIYYDDNVAGSLALLQELVAAGVMHLVFSSTCAVYGQPGEVPIAETALKRPMSPYGRSKLIVEEMLADFDRAYGLRSVSLRCSMRRSRLLGAGSRAATHSLGPDRPCGAQIAKVGGTLRTATEAEPSFEQGCRASRQRRRSHRAGLNFQALDLSA